MTAIGDEQVQAWLRSSPRPRMRRLAATLAALAVACACTAPSEPLLLSRSGPPAHRNPDERVQPMALMDDVLVTADRGCIVARGVTGRYTLVFPPGYSLRGTGPRATIVTSEGKMWARLQQRRTFGGGETAGQGVRHLARCPAPYWGVNHEFPFLGRRPPTPAPPPRSPP